jgi:hypothetical protein
MKNWKAYFANEKNPKIVTKKNTSDFRFQVIILRKKLISIHLPYSTYNERERRKTILFTMIEKRYF